MKRWVDGVLKGFAWLLPVMVMLGVAGGAHAAVAGRVLDAWSGRPIPGAVVTSAGTEVRSDGEGRFTLETGASRVRLRAPGYLRQSVASVVDGTNVLLHPFTPKALYLSFYGIGSRVLRQPALELIEKSELNALVIDVKGDRGLVPFASEVPLARAIDADRIRTVRDPGSPLADLKARGIYTIARIVTFKDNQLAETHPDWAVKDATGRLWRDGEGLAWVDPFQPGVWDYNIALAEEAARLGFDEVQFDYVRFPSQGGAVFSRPSSEASRVHAISTFLWMARRQLRPYNVFIGADIFGYVCWNRNDTAIGQRLRDLAPYVDYVSPMLYPSGFQYGVGNYRNPVENPYQVVYLTLAEGARRAGIDARRFRPWLQAFRDYAFDRRRFGAAAVSAQTEASEAFGSSGWMLWNPRNVYRDLGFERQHSERTASVAPEMFGLGRSVQSGGDTATF